MKKFTIAIAVLFIFFMAFGDLSAGGIGIKGGYSKMMDDYSDADFDDTWCLGIFFDAGTFLFDSLRFRPGFDYLTLENDAGNFADVWGIHLDWYWFFSKSGSISPFLGFGPALNYYNYDNDSTQGDSDAGIEGFGGIDFNLSGPLTLIFEMRLVFHDIADRNATILKGNVGFLYSF